LESLSEKSCLKTAYKQKKQRRTVKILRCKLFDHLILTDQIRKSQALILFSVSATKVVTGLYAHFHQYTRVNFLRKTPFEKTGKILV